MMKFLCIGRDIGFTVPVDPAQLAGVLEMIYIKSFQIMEKWETEKKVTGGLFAGQKAGFLVLEASSGEELSKLLTSLPFWGNENWEVIPLQSFQSGIEETQLEVNKLKQAAAAMRQSKP